MEIDGKEYLFYKAIPIDVAMFEELTADEKRQCVNRREAISLEFSLLALAAKGVPAVKSSCKWKE